MLVCHEVPCLLGLHAFVVHICLLFCVLRKEMQIIMCCHNPCVQNHNLYSAVVRVAVG